MSGKLELSAIDASDALDAGETLREFRAAAGLSQMALAVRVGVTLPAVSGWERNLYRPRRPTAQRLDDELQAGGSLVAAFGYAPLPSPPEALPIRDPEVRVQRLEQIVADLAHRLNQIQEAVVGNRGGAFSDSMGSGQNTQGA